MVSMVEASRSVTNNYNNDSSAMDSVTKPEPMREVSVCSSVSTPEGEMEALNPDVTQTQKRKGGRKPVCKSVIFLLFLTACVLLNLYSCHPGLRYQCTRSFESGEPHAPPLAFFDSIIIHTFAHDFSRYSTFMIFLFDVH